MNGSLQSIGDLAVAQATLPNMGKAKNMANIDKAAQDFTAVFMTQMLQPMFEGVGTDPTFGGGHGEEVMKTFLLQEYGKIAAKNTHFGIADAVKREMLHAQEQAQSQNQPTPPTGGNNVNRS